MALTPQDAQELLRLIPQATFPLPREVFEAFCFNFITVAVEIALFREKNDTQEVFLTYREDPLFSGWHIPGSVIRPNESITETVQRVQDEEFAMEISAPVFHSWHERMKGEKVGDSVRGHEYGFLYTSELVGEARETETEKFFPVNAIPKDLLRVHTRIVQLFGAV